MTNCEKFGGTPGRYPKSFACRLSLVACRLSLGWTVAPVACSKIDKPAKIVASVSLKEFSLAFEKVYPSQQINEL